MILFEIYKKFFIFLETWNIHVLSYFLGFFSNTVEKFVWIWHYVTYDESKLLSRNRPRKLFCLCLQFFMTNSNTAWFTKVAINFTIKSKCLSCVLSPSQLPTFVTNELCQVFTASCVLPSEQDLQDIHSLWENYLNLKTLAIKDTKKYWDFFCEDNKIILMPYKVV